ncbi:MAG: hypothetical protein E7331_01230 [Clostridiales bacterium]|nr:hypothetical protein [Clostridiales bacterium]
MKKILALLLCLCLCLILPALAASAQTEDFSQYFDFFLSRYGNIVFSMVKAPNSMAWDQDLLPSDRYEDFPSFFGWKNKTQLHYSSSTGEWQYHLADISIMKEEVRAAYPEDDEQTLCRRTLVNFMELCTNFSGGSAGAYPQGELRWIKYDTPGFYGAEGEFEYGDLPGVTYQCTGIFDGSTHAVVLMGTKNESYAAMADVLGPITPEQEELLQQRTHPQTYTVKRMTVSFPKEGSFEEYQDGTCLLDCFLDSYNYVFVEYSPMDTTAFFAPGGDTNEELAALARRNGDNLVAEGAAEKAEVSLFADGVALLTVHDNASFGAHRIHNFFFTTEGIYRLAFFDTEEGWDILETVSFSENTLQ